MNFLKEKATKAMKALKSMKPETVRILYIAVSVAAFALFGLCSLTHSYALAVISILLMLGDLIFFLAFYRCPYCGKFLGRDGGNYCPHCGKWVSK